MKLKYKLMRKFKWARRLNHWYLMTFHRERTLRNFKAFLKEIEEDEEDEEINIK